MTNKVSEHVEEILIAERERMEKRSVSFLDVIIHPRPDTKQKGDGQSRAHLSFSNPSYFTLRTHAHLVPKTQ